MTMDWSVTSCTPLVTRHACMLEAGVQVEEAALIVSVVNPIYIYNILDKLEGHFVPI